jgi:adenylate cyclase class IV
MQHLSLLNIFHYVLVILMAILPFVLQSVRGLRMYIIFMLCVILSWDLNEGRCIVTDIEKSSDDGQDFKENEELIEKIANNLGLDMNKRFPRKAALMLTIIAASKLV